MPITEALKTWLVKNEFAQDGQTDDEYRLAAGKALADGKLTPVKYAELCTDKDAKKADEIGDKLDMVIGSISKLAEAMTVQKQVVPEKKEEKKEEPEDKKSEDTPEPTGVKKVIASQGGTSDDSEKTAEVRVKAVREMYDSTKRGMTYPASTKLGRPHSKAGQPVVHMGRALDEPSQLDKAYAGVFAKWQIVSSMRGASPLNGFNALSEHEKNLLTDLAENGEWDNSRDGRPSMTRGFIGEMGGRGIKALIDDSTSGGLEAAPIVFDDQVISAPLLYGELYPLVNVVTLDRGRRVEGVATGNITGSWGGVDNTSISLFDTASYVSAFDTTIYRWEGAVHLGLDFLSDTPIDFGSHITAQYGERLLEDLDDVIATGDGSTQPEGIVNKATVTSVSWGSATSLGNYESLRFSVAKAEHKANLMSTVVFCGTETSYQRARAIPVGTADARRIFGLTYDDYALMQRPYKINESLADTQVFYAILGRYRMYRRRGLTIRTSMEGDTLMRKNALLIVAMARYGGQLERGVCAGLTSDAPA